VQRRTRDFPVGAGEHSVGTWSFGQPGLPQSSFAPAASHSGGGPLRVRKLLDLVSNTVVHWPTFGCFPPVP
jgi:hypothetical protein